MVQGPAVSTSVDPDDKSVTTRTSFSGVLVCLNSSLPCQYASIQQASMLRYSRPRHRGLTCLLCRASCRTSLTTPTLRWLASRLSSWGAFRASNSLVLAMRKWVPCFAAFWESLQPLVVPSRLPHLVAAALCAWS